MYNNDNSENASRGQKYETERGASPPWTYPCIWHWSTEGNDTDRLLNLRRNVAHTRADDLHDRLQSEWWAKEVKQYIKSWQLITARACSVDMASKEQLARGSEDKMHTIAKYTWLQLTPSSPPTRWASSRINKWTFWTFLRCFQRRDTVSHFSGVEMMMLPCQKVKQIKKKDSKEPSGKRCATPLLGIQCHTVILCHALSPWAK